MINKNTHPDEDKRGKSFRKDLFEKGARRSSGTRFEGFFENKKSLGVRRVL
jgi:hypothetical protein